jgi:hypothetical protein
MKRSSGKRGSRLSGGKSPKVARREDVRIAFPKLDVWKDIVRDRKLKVAQAKKLEIAVKEALDDIDRYHAKLQSRPSRDVLVKHLKRFEKVLKRLQNECQRSAKLMEFFLPFDTLGFIGQSLTFLAMSEALGRNVLPKNYDFQLEFKQSRGKRITLASVEQDTRPMREALGLKHGHLILTYLVKRIHGPLERWIELDRLNEGGRKPDAVRRHLIYRLAEASPGILGKAAAISTTGKFVDLCSAVLVACGLPESGIAKAVPTVVKRLRADQAKFGQAP